MQYDESCGICPTAFMVKEWIESGMATFVALLQGINLGANRRIAMPALREILVDLGLSDVATYIQSGNVVFSAGAISWEALATAIGERIQSDFGLDVPVIIRSGDEMRRIFQSNPFLSGEDDLKRLHVTFLDHAPGDRVVARLDDVAFPPDAYRVQGQEIFVRHINGVAGSPIDFGRIARTLGVARTTSRNWRTVTRLAGMAHDRP